MSHHFILLSFFGSSFLWLFALSQKIGYYRHSRKTSKKLQHITAYYTFLLHPFIANEPLVRKLLWGSIRVGSTLARELSLRKLYRWTGINRKFHAPPNDCCGLSKLISPTLYSEAAGSLSPLELRDMLYKMITGIRQDWSKQAPIPHVSKIPRGELRRIQNSI